MDEEWMKNEIFLIYSFVKRNEGKEYDDEWIDDKELIDYPHFNSNSFGTCFKYANKVMVLGE